jgi:hypothetical protein
MTKQRTPMLIACNPSNLRKHAASLFGNEGTAKLPALIAECTKGFIRDTTPAGRPFGHISHDYAAHIGRIDAILGNHGVEGGLWDKEGNDMAGNCSMDGVKWDVHYSNAGDTYATTILYVNGKLKIGDWGTLFDR